MKKFLAMVLGLLMTFSTLAMFGCGCDDEDSGEENATVITMYCQEFENWITTWMNEKKDAFNEDKTDGIQLEIKYFQEDAYTDSLKVARENNQAPDIFMTSYGNLYNDSIKTGHAAPLNDLLDSKYYDDILDNVKPMVSFGDKYYAYPQLMEPSTLFFYRKDILLNAGVNKVPKSWTDLLSVCEKVKTTALKKGQYALGLPTGMALGWATYGMQYDATNGVALNDDWTEILVKDNEGWRDLCGLFYDLYKGGYVPAGSISAKGYIDIIEGLCQGKIAMAYAGSWSIAELFDTYPEMVDSIGVAVIPTRDGNQTGITATNGGWTYSISNSIDDDHKKKAAKVIEYFFCEDAARTGSYFDAAQYSKACVTKSVQSYLDTNADASKKEWLNIVNKVASNAVAEPTYAWDISNAVATMLESMAINTDKEREGLITQEIATCISTIEGVMTRSDWTTNPRA